MSEPGGEGQPQKDPGAAFQARMEAFGREAQAAGERLGREAEVAGQRLARDPDMVAFGTWITRLIGLAFIVVGLWLFGSLSLGLDLPMLDWRLAWPALIVLVGVLVVVSAMTRRR
jgi:hypothetical protein